MDVNGGVDLLWGTGERPRLDPKPGLSLERIVQAAIAVADEDGLAGLSMRRVAERLGSPTMSLYRHVPGKAELIRVMQDRVLGEVPVEDPTAAGWRSRLAAHARQDFALHQRHPWTLHLAGTGQMPGPNEVARLDAALGALAETALAGADTVAVVSIVGGYAQSAARSTVGPAQLKQRGATTDAWWSSRSSFWERVSRTRFPALAAALEAGGFDEPKDTFEFGLQRLLDGIEVLVRVREEQRSKR